MFRLNIIRNILRERNIPIKMFAESIGMSESGMQQLLAKNSTSTKTLEKIAIALNVNLSTFIFQDENVDINKTTNAVPHRTDIWTRINIIRVSENMNQKQFAEMLNVNEKTFNAMMSRKTDPGLEVIKALLSSYPTMDPRWILLGEESQYPEESNIAAENSIQYKRKGCKECEYYKKIISNQNVLIDELKKRQNL